MITQILEPKDYSEKAIKIYESLGFTAMTAIPNPETEVLVIRLVYKLDKQFLDNYPNLKYIVSPTTGLNHIDLEECEKRGIKVISLKGEAKWLGKNITSTAEHTWALILSLIRNVPGAFMDVKLGRWNRDNWIGHQLKGKILGVIGYGRVGQQVSEIAEAFQMQVLGIDKQHGQFGTEFLLQNSDIISIHVDLNDSTYNLIKKEQFDMMKPSAYLINTSRGEVIDEEDLLMALKNKKIAGAALDVLWDEDSNGKHLLNNPLWEYSIANNNLIITPHIAGATFESMRMTEDYVASKLFNLLQKDGIIKDIGVNEDLAART